MVAITQKAEVVGLVAHGMVMMQHPYAHRSLPKLGKTVGHGIQRRLIQRPCAAQSMDSHAHTMAGTGEKEDLLQLLQPVLGAVKVPVNADFQQPNVS